MISSISMTERAVTLKEYEGISKLHLIWSWSAKLYISLGLVFLIIWLQSRKLTFEINTISKEKLQIELKSTNTKDVEEFMKFLNKSIQ